MIEEKLEEIYEMTVGIIDKYPDLEDDMEQIRMAVYDLVEMWNLDFIK